MFETLKQLDRDLLLLINGAHNAFLDVILWQLSKDWPTVLLVLLFTAYFYSKFKLRNSAALILGVLLSLACTDLSTNLVKRQVKRYRPTHNLEIAGKIHVVNEYRGGQYCFFSSHAANVFGIVSFLFLVSARFRAKWRYLLFIYPCMVGYSRIYLGVHYPSDIITGFISGAIFGSLVYRIINKHFFHFGHAGI
ncbi:MAG TPA: phosphatase PAP2 family protein [Bacteroidia bacterium]|nr:phosphatase PAP2 family protein [Bacteroidia bacterium]